MTERRSRGPRARLEGGGEGNGIAGEDRGRESFDAPDLLTELLDEDRARVSHGDSTRSRRGLRAWLRARRARREGGDQPQGAAPDRGPDLLEELLEPDRAAPDFPAPTPSANEPVPEAAEPPQGDDDSVWEAAEVVAPPRASAGARPRRRRWFGPRRAAPAEAAPDLLGELLNEPAAVEPTGPDFAGEDPRPAPAGPRARRRGRHSVRPAPERDTGADDDDDGASREALERFSVLPAAAGPRRTARQRRRTRVRRRLLALLIVIVLGVAGVGISQLEWGAERDSRRTGPALVPTADDDVTTTLVFGTTAGRDGSPEGVIWMSLLSLNEAGGEGSVVYIPAHTATEVPGRGLLGLGESVTSGGIPLLRVSTEALLGVPVDHHLELSAEDAGRLFDRTGEITVDVPAEVSVTAGRDQARVLFEPGPQSLPAESLVELLFTTGIGGDDAELGSRHLAFWGGFFQEFSGRPAALSESLSDAAPALRDTDLRPDELARFVGGLAELPPDARTLASLPAQQVSVGGEQLYQVDDEQVAEFIANTVGGANELGTAARVQILNGNGVPGIGQEVAQRLMGEGFRVVLSGNSRNLNTRRTRIVSYDDSVAGLRTAERAQRLLGVGEVQVSSQGQGIVDLTIVVGRDFLRKS